ncbi:hypothetical protein Tco_1485258 [Tanacetum coccineum]
MRSDFKHKSACAFLKDKHKWKNPDSTNARRYRHQETKLFRDDALPRPPGVHRIAKSQPLGWHLEEIHVTWAHFGKKQTRLQLYTKSYEERPYNGWRRRQDVKETASGFLLTASEVADLKKH